MFFILLGVRERFGRCDFEISSLFLFSWFVGLFVFEEKTLKPKIASN